MGEHGEKVEFSEIPEKLKEEAKNGRKYLLEQIVETDDKLMGRYLEGQEISKDEIRKAIRNAVINNNLVPVFCGSALKNKGVQMVLDGVVDYLPSPIDLPPTKGLVPRTDRGNGARTER